MEEKFKVEIKGIAPLLMNKFDEEKQDKNTKYGSAKNYQKEAENCLYLNSKGKICQPATHIEAGIVKMATSYRIPGGGKKTFKDATKSGIFIEPDLIQHKNQKWIIDKRAVVINRGRIVKARPKLEKWGLEFIITNIDGRITPAIIEQIIKDMGKYNGLGDFRPRYGRFKVIKFEPIKAS